MRLRKGWLAVEAFLIKHGVCDRLLSGRTADHLFRRSARLEACRPHYFLNLDKPK